MKHNEDFRITFYDKHHAIIRSVIVKAPDVFKAQERAKTRVKDVWEELEIENRYVAVHARNCNGIVYVRGYLDTTDSISPEYLEKNKHLLMDNYIYSEAKDGSLQKFVANTLNHLYGDGEERKIILGAKYPVIQDAVNYVCYNYSDDWQEGVDAIDPKIIA